MSRGRGAAACTLALLIATGPGAAVAQTDVFATGVVTGDFLYNTDEEASVADARFELDLIVGPVTAGSVFRAYQLSDPSYNPRSVYVPPAELKHLYAEYVQGELLLRGGNYLETFGRGITLRAYEEVALEYDTTLDGLLGEYTWDWAEFTLLTGVVTEDVTAVRHREHIVQGTRLWARATDWLSLAGSALGRSATEKDDEVELPDEISRFEDVVLGGEVDAWLGPVTVGIEYAGRSGENPVTEEQKLEGHAGYATVTAMVGPVTFFGEYKDYDDYYDYMVNPPTAVKEHPWTLMNRATYQIDLNDERGWLAEGSASVGSGGFISGGASEARNHDSDLRHWEIYGDYVHTFDSGTILAFAGSWQREYLFVGETASGKFTERFIGAGEVDFSLGTGQIELVVEAERLDAPDGEPYEDLLTSVAWYPTPTSTVIATAEKTTDDVADGERDTWFIVELRKTLAQDLDVSLSGGTQRGGKICTGGICYVEPEFEGARLRFTKYF